MQSLETKQAEERAHARAKLEINERKTAARRLQQLEMEDVALNTAKKNTRNTACAKPTPHKLSKTEENVLKVVLSAPIQHAVPRVVRAASGSNRSVPNG